MIFATIGTQLPFDRLIKALDLIATDLSIPIFAQIGKSANYHPENMDWVETVDQPTFERLVQQCTLIVSHAGIGTVLTARRYCKPILIMPRSASLGEHRNDHQMATATQLKGLKGVYVAESASDLRIILSMKNFEAPSTEISERLINLKRSIGEKIG